MKILLLNGPNLNLLGKREEDIYGNTSLEDLNERLISAAKKEDCEFTSIQSNAEHELINEIHSAVESNIDVILINPAAYTHTSIAIRDALLGVNIPFYEIHISDISTREDFRNKSYLSDIAEKVYSGLGVDGYEMALNEAISKFKNK
jgi:3-dehydroquinate dehydratase-2